MAAPATDNLKILLSRLLWPSAMVRERAAVALAELIAARNPESTRARKALLAWIGEQPLESTAAIGLVVLARVAELSPRRVPALPTLMIALRRPSILSYLLLRDLHGEGILAPDWSRLTAGAAPPEFEPSAFFTKYGQTFVPPIYAYGADWAERQCGVPLSRQWAYEWDQLLRRDGRVPSPRPLDFRGREHGQNLIVDFPLSEYYRSAYLRALAWAIASGGLSEANAFAMALEACPIDLALWGVRPGRQPAWWPSPEEPAGEIDTVPAQIWNQLATLWQRTTGGADAAVLAADGRVYEGKAVYDLSIRGVFQATRGAERGDLAQLFDECEKATGLHDAHGLRFAGRLRPDHPARLATGSGDWAVVPASVWVAPSVSSRWRFWRGQRSMRLPAPFLGAVSLAFRCWEEGVEILDSGTVVATWRDWTAGLQEELTADLSPRTGWALSADRDLVDRFARESGAVFAWLCRLTGYHRRGDYEPFKQFSDYQIFGATNLVMPRDYPIRLAE